MPGLAELLFGPDGIGGQPGLVGKAGNAIWNGTGDLPEGAGFGATLANSLGNIPHMLTDIAVKNPLEILKNPMSALNDRGEVSITRLLFPDFRREVVKQEQQQNKLRDAFTQSKIVNAYGDLFFGPNSGMSPAQGKNAAVDAGLDPRSANTLMNQDYADSAAMQDARSSVPADIAPLIGTPEQALRVMLAANRDAALAQRQGASDARAQAASDREEVRFGERITPAQRQATRVEAQRAKEAAAQAAKSERQRERQQARAQSLADRIAGKNAEIAAKAAGEASDPKVLAAPSQTEIDAKGNDYNPFNNYPAGTKSRESIVDDITAQAEASKKAYAAEIDKALPLNRLKNIRRRKDAKEVVSAVVDAAHEGAQRQAAIGATVSQAKDRKVPLANIVSALVSSGYSPQEIGPVLTENGYSREEIEAATSGG